MYVCVYVRVCTVWLIIFVGCQFSLFSWLTWQSRKFPPTKINAYRYVSIDEGRGQKRRGSAACVNNRYYHPADGVFDTNILLSHDISPTFLQKWLRYRERVLIT
jgi:hypothetical protein